MKKITSFTIDHIKLQPGIYVSRKDRMGAETVTTFDLRLTSRTGFYLLLFGDYSSRDVLELVLGCFRFVRDFRGEVPGASAKDCGNYLDMNLPMANYWGAKYAALLENITDDRLVYPE